MKSCQVTINNKAGIHCRPSGVICNALDGEFPGHTLKVISPSGEAEIHGILDLLTLSLTCGTTATLEVIGPREEQALRRLKDLFEYKFDFPPREKTEQKA